jgi:hypothetical protein
MFASWQRAERTFSCRTHALAGGDPVTVTIRDEDPVLPGAKDG